MTQHLIDISIDSMSIHSTNNHHYSRKNINDFVPRCKADGKIIQIMITKNCTDEFSLFFIYEFINIWLIFN